MSNAISAIIITKNEAADIEACIVSIAWMDEIIVLDANSSDGTQDICRKYRVKLIETDWPGFGQQKQRALAQATCDWVFSIDADERVCEKLKKEIKQILASDNGYSAYKVPRRTFFYGRPLMHSFKPKNDAPIRLFKRDSGNFPDDIVHECAMIDGKIGKLKNPLLHYSFRNLEELLAKVNSYSTLGAEKLAAQNKKSNIFKTFFHAIWAFTKFYCIKGGCLDGWIGFLIAFSNFEYTFYRYAKLIERKKVNNIVET